MNYKFGKQSLKHLSECHEDLQRVMMCSIHASPYDFSIIEGHRPIEEQLKAYRAGKSQIDGVKRKGKHNRLPSHAVDVFPYPGTIDGVSAWNDHFRFKVIGGVVLACAKLLEIPIRWGADWDGDGSRQDQSLHDLPHFELVGYPAE